ncbi:MAG: DUF4198 domain-containing protein [Vicinamibacteria bacterium]
MAKPPAPEARVRGAWLALLVLVLPSSGWPHDLWMVPGKYRLRADEPTRVFINNGDSFPESLTLVGGHRIAEMRSWSPAGELQFSEFRVDGKSLTFEFQSSAEGVHVLGLATRPRTVRMKAEDFEAYLAEERLTAIAAMREELGESAEPAVERYAKWAKAVVGVEPVPAEGASLWSEPVGHRLEIVPLDYPNRLEPGGTLRIRVLFEGAPLAGAAIVGARASGPAREIEIAADASGEAALTVTAPGRWYVRAIHMIRLQGDPDVQWESYWGTLTFEVSSVSP